MGLFNFISLSLFPSEYLHKISSQEVLYNNKDSENLKHNILRVKSYDSVRGKMNSSKKKLYIANESIYRFSRLNNFNSSLLQELINKYWQQTIFLSISNPTTQKYINQLSKQETLIAKNKKKKLLIDFSKALLYGNIDTDLMSFNNIKESNLPSLQYRWKKGLNCIEPKCLNGLWQNKRSPKFPNKHQFILLKYLKQNNFPVFTVVNGFKQLVVAEPSDKLVNKNNLGNSLYEWYYDRFLWTKDIGGLYEGWFFINPQDAEEYKNYIADKYSRSTKHHGLSVASSSIHFFYRLNRTAPPRTEFRLFPDLEEVAKLLTKQQYNSNIIFDKNQKYGRSYFQGQPIYIIEPFTSNSKKSHKIKLINYFYQIPGDKTETKYNAVFLNKDTALQAWQKFCQNNSEYNLPTQPILRVYNLEDFLKDYERQNELHEVKFLLIPSNDAYIYIKKKYEKLNNISSYEAINKYAHSYILTSKLWLRRVVWSLTSRQPPNW